jgi:hypothetical protein
MTTSTDVAGYAAMVAEAEAAVAAVKDPELRRAGFEKILATLLESATVKPSRGKRRAREQGHLPAAGGRAVKGTSKGPKANVDALIDDGFFKTPRTIAEVRTELADRGHHIAVTSLSGPLQTLTQERRLRRQKVSAKKKGSKTTYAYSNW